MEDTELLGLALAVERRQSFMEIILFNGAQVSAE
jgi:hypothetical protein